MDLAVQYVYDMTKGKYKLNGNARDAISPSWNVIPNPYFEVIENRPETEVKVGDILVYTKGFFDNKFGHISIVFSNPTLQTCYVLEQNWDGYASTPAKKRFENYYGVSHIIRFKN